MPQVFGAQDARSDVLKAVIAQVNNLVLATLGTEAHGYPHTEFGLPAADATTVQEGLNFLMCLYGNWDEHCMTDVLHKNIDLTNVKADGAAVSPTTKALGIASATKFKALANAHFTQGAGATNVHYADESASITAADAVESGTKPHEALSANLDEDDPTNEATLIAYTIKLQTKWALHLADTDAHEIADTSNTLTASAAPESTAECITVLNELKGDHNTHRSENGVHYVDDTGNAVTADNADDEASAITLAIDIHDSLNGHMNASVDYLFVTLCGDIRTQLATHLANAFSGTEMIRMTP